MWVISIERSQVSTFHVSSRPPLSFLSLVAKRSSPILCCKQQKAGWMPGKRLKSYKFTSFSDTWVASFPGSSPAIVTTPERSLGSRNEKYVCKLGSLLVIWEVEQFQDGGVKEGCLCDKIDRYRQMVLWVHSHVSSRSLLPWNASCLGLKLSLNTTKVRTWGKTLVDEVSPLCLLKTGLYCELFGSYFHIFWQQCKVPAENMAVLAELYASCRSPSAADL